ncbi:MAG: LexA family transcriptional regulator [Spirochaetaceae bacterium]|jgi:transcriptional regulator with XRE-family HTH domain|nr:LexA family transcriptional regulator [Spirochaetaceae bacterium]
MSETGYSLRLREIREALDLNIAEFARQLVVPRSTLVGWEAGKSVSIEVLKPLETRFNVNIDWLLTGKGEMFFTTLPHAQSVNEVAKTETGFKLPLLRQKVSCESGTDWQDEHNIVDYIEIFNLLPRLNAKRLFALCVEGSSMLGAGIRNGDYVLFDATEGRVLGDGVYVFALDGDVYCKRLEFDGISRKVKIYSVRVADLEKAELLATIDMGDMSAAERLTIFGQVLYWVHPNTGDN